MKCVIYTLSDPRTEVVRYVGQSTRIKNRYAVHVSPFTKDDKSRRRAWIVDLLSEGLKPVLSIAEECDLSELNAREEFWIEHYRAQGANLLNVAAAAVARRCAEAILRLSEITAQRNRARKGIPLSKEVRAHLSTVHRERLAALTPEQRRQRVAAALAKRRPGYNSGWRHADSSRAAIGAANRSSNKRRGHHLTAQHKANIGAANREAAARKREAQHGR